MKFIHMADMHLDMPFTVLNGKNKLGEKRRMEQRSAMKAIIEYIKRNNIEYLFIAGDLYEHEYIRRTTIEYINNLFKEIPSTKIYITPGNHDPYINGSMYKTFNWSDNVHIFSEKIEIIENIDCDVYGYGFDDFYKKDTELDEISIKNKNKVNILITHGNLYGGTKEDMEYNPINKNKLKQIGFDYVALGHIHKSNYNDEDNQRIVYSGSTISTGFDELGNHGVILGEINKETLNLEFLNIDNKEFKEIELNISEINSKEELIEKINLLNLKNDIYYKLILVGDKNFEINIYDLIQFVNIDNIIKIKNNTKIKINLEEISKNNNLKGLFVKEVLKELNENNYSKEILEETLEIGLNVIK